MSFASYEFILLFLPLTVLLFWIAQRISVSIALWLLCFASLVFYIYWNPRDVLVAGASIAFNYQAAKVIIQGGTRGKLMFAAAVTGNLFALGYFKYLGFAVELLAMAYGDNHASLPAIICHWGFRSSLSPRLHIWRIVMPDKFPPANTILATILFCIVLSSLDCGPDSPSRRYHPAVSREISRVP